MIELICILINIGTLSLSSVLRSRDFKPKILNVKWILYFFFKLTQQSQV